MGITNRQKLKSYYAILIVSLSLLPITCRKSLDPGAGSDPADLLPMDNDISGFKRKGSPAIMTDYQSIMDAINGAGEKYIDFGFVEGVQQFYSNGAIDVDIQICNQGTQANAEGLFQEFYPPSPEMINENEPTVVIDHSILLGYMLIYTRKNIFLRISTTEKTDFALNMAKQFYWNIDRKISSE